MLMSLLPPSVVASAATMAQAATPVLAPTRPKQPQAPTAVWKATRWYNQHSALTLGLALLAIVPAAQQAQQVQALAQLCAAPLGKPLGALLALVAQPTFTPLQQRRWYDAKPQLQPLPALMELLKQMPAPAVQAIGQQWLAQLQQTL